MSELKDCRLCYHSIKSYGKLQCLAMNLPKPVEYMRHESLGDCGPNAIMFEPKIGRHVEFQGER